MSSVKKRKIPNEHQNIFRLHVFEAIVLHIKAATPGFRRPMLVVPIHWKTDNTAIILLNLA